MKFCQPHWDKLREAILARGLGHLIAANGRDAAARVVAEVQGKAENDDFDPPMGAHWMIAGRAIDVFGPGMLMGEYCPICEFLKDGAWPAPPPGHRYSTNESYFIDGPADAMQEMAREKGLAA